eukprot:TRINITY_DN1165_c0_g1_i1.p2 TRINITY_DN1165_c0_g1~~TRINITY_DN1165_c0_g1_i1.p2  ORF type:complete len:121 (+),score=39.30 TRINITY_DN1165_c0_g1_i1:23-364(+)
MYRMLCAIPRHSVKAVSQARGISSRTLSAFQQADFNNDGFLQVPELKAMLKNQGCNLTEVQLHDLVDSIDINRDGQVSLEEFQEFLYPTSFDGCDGEDDGGVTEREMRELAAL